MANMFIHGIGLKLSNSYWHLTRGTNLSRWWDIADFAGRSWICEKHIISKHIHEKCKQSNHHWPKLLWSRRTMSRAGNYCQLIISLNKKSYNKSANVFNIRIIIIIFTELGCTNKQRQVQKHTRNERYRSGSEVRM